MTSRDPNTERPRIFTHLGGARGIARSRSAPGNLAGAKTSLTYAFSHAAPISAMYRIRRVRIYAMSPIPQNFRATWRRGGGISPSFPPSSPADSILRKIRGVSSYHRILTNAGPHDIWKSTHRRSGDNGWQGGPCALVINIRKSNPRCLISRDALSVDRRREISPIT